MLKYIQRCVTELEIFNFSFSKMKYHYHVPIVHVIPASISYSSLKSDFALTRIVLVNLWQQCHGQVRRNVLLVVLWEYNIHHIFVILSCLKRLTSFEGNENIAWRKIIFPILSSKNRLHDTPFLFYKNSFYKNHEAKNRPKIKIL